MMESDQNLSFLETHCSLDGEDIQELRNSQKEKCSICNKLFHFPECWNKHKEETGHKNI